MANITNSKKRQGIGYRRSVQLLVYLCIVPTALLLALGIVTMIIGQAGFDLLLGILMVSFVAAMTTGVVLVLVFIRREANLSELQADFVSKVSHELRTPLTAIRLFSETLERSKDDGKTQEECVRMLVQETEKLSRRIGRLLDWGRMEAGRKLFEMKPTRAFDVVHGAMDAFSPLRSDDTLVFEAQVDDGLPEVLVDRDAMIDAILNLLSNARKYGGTPPAVSLRAYLTEKHQVAFEVTDNGGGIPRAFHRRIFEKFYRIDDRLSRTQEGSGLGLAIVKHIVRAHKGRVIVESAPGKGSTFRILLAPVPQNALTHHAADAAPAE